MVPGGLAVCVNIIGTGGKTRSALNLPTPIKKLIFIWLTSLLLPVKQGTMLRYFFFLLLLPLGAIAQKQLTLQDIYVKGTFRGDFARTSFAKSPPARITGKDLLDASGKSIGEPDEVVTSAANKYLHLVKQKTEPIYRHSSKSIVYLYNSDTRALVKLANEKVLHPQFSPNGENIAYVKDNNLFIFNIPTQKTTPITTDGKWNHIINGNSDWVYEEEFSFTQAYQWSPKGNYLAYYKFDESKVKEYSFTLYDNEYNKEYRYKYPKAGDDNSVVTIHLYNVQTGNQVEAQFERGDIYIPRIKWATQDDQLIVFWMNRHQNHLKLLQTNAANGSSKLLYEEKNKYYVDITDDWYFLKNGSQYLFTSEMGGYNGLYLYSMDGAVKTRLTKMDYDVTDVNGVDEKNGLVYYTLAYPTPMDRALFVTDFSGKNTFNLSTRPGYRSFVFNDDFSKFYERFSTINTPQTVSLYSILKRRGKITAPLDSVISENKVLQALMASYNFGKAEFLKVPNGKGDEINGWILKPAHFDPAKKYPVLFCNYGGPGSQSVANNFGSAGTWHQLLAQKGFIIVAFDNTGTGYRGEEFKKKTYLQLGKYEIEDQIAAARWLAQQPWVDAKHIGHWGWSFGGFMSSLAVTKGADVFSAAVAVAPVTNWRFYDNIYTERYMRTPKENPGGYDDNSPIFFTDRVKGKYLIIHGTADDNVHFQNATQMVTALVKSNVPFDSFYYPNKNHGIGGFADNTTLHLRTLMTNWIIQNLGNENTDKTILK